MRRHEAHERLPLNGSGHRRRLPLVGGGVVAAAVLAHLMGGGLLMHAGLPALLLALGIGTSPASLGGGVLLGALVAIVAVKLLMVLGVARLVGRSRSGAHARDGLRHHYGDTSAGGGPSC